MKLLVFIHSMHSGGAERVTATLANHWAEKGWQVSVVTMTSSTSDFYEINPDVNRIALDVATNSAGPISAIVNNLRRIIALRRVLKEIKPDIALGMMSTANILLALASTGLKGLIKIGSEHTYPPCIFLGRPWELMRRFTYGKLDAVTVLTRESAAWVCAHTRAEKTPIIPNAVLFPLPIQEPLLSPFKESDQNILLAVGRLDKGKGFDILIEAFQRLADNFSGWQLYILGEGSLRATLQAQIDVIGMVERIFLPGRVGNIGEWYESADLYVMSSRFEGFPNTLAEAMAHGLSAVSFDCDTGPRDIIRHEVDGFLVPAGDVGALETALRRLMGNTELRQQFASRAIEIRERYSLERVVRMWEELFLELKNPSV